MAVFPFGYSDILKELSHYERAAWKDRVRGYKSDRCHVIPKYRNNRLWRIAIIRPDGSLVRFFYERQATIVATLWDHVLPKRKQASSRPKTPTT